MVKLSNINRIEREICFRQICFLLFILVLASNLGVKAQTDLDSLHTVWQDESRTDSLRVDAYSNFVRKGFIPDNLDSAWTLTDALVKYSEEEDYAIAMGKAFSLKGSIFWSRGNYSEAYGQFKKSLEVYEIHGAYTEIAQSLSSIGHLHDQMGNYSEALDAFLRKQKIDDLHNDTLAQAFSLNAIAGIYGALNERLKAIEYYEQSIEIKQQLGREDLLPNDFHSIGNNYRALGDFSAAHYNYTKALELNNDKGYLPGVANELDALGDLYRLQDSTRTALNYFTKSLKIRKEIGDTREIAESYYSLAYYYDGIGNFKEALKYFKLCLTIHEEQDNEYEKALVINDIGYCYLELEDYQSAMSYCEKGFEMTGRLGGLREKLYACECLMEVYSALGNSAKELEYYKVYNEIEESFHMEESAQRLQEMEFENTLLQDSMKKAEEARLVEESHNEEMQTEARTRNIGFGVGFLFVLLAIGFYSRWRYVTKSKASLQIEKDRSENLLLNILPEEIAQELKEKGKADARNFELVSILFTDFKDFTEASARLSAKELVHEINTCFQAFDGIIENYGIEKIKTIGDAYMCAGGLPVPSDDSVKNTVLAALDMQAFIGKRKNEMTAKGLPAFEMRVGIHTGPVVAGIVGVKKFQYDLWGDTVNTASRIESKGEVGKVNISQTTYDMLKADPDFTFESRGKIEAKGKGEIEMWFVGKS